MPGQVEQGVDLGHRHRLRPGGHLHDLITGLHSALAQHPEVEPWPVMGNQQRRHTRIIHPDAHPVAGNPWLGHLEHRLANAVAITDAHLVIGQAVDCEVLPELPVLEVIAVQLLLPVPVGRHLVHEHRPVLPAMPRQVALAVAVDVQPPHHPRSPGRPLPHRRAHRPAAPGHIPRQADVHRQQGASTRTSSHQHAPHHRGLPAA